MLVRIIIKSKSTEEFIENLTIYEWTFTDSSIIKGSLNISNFLNLSTRAIKSDSIIIAGELLYTEEWGVAIIIGGNEIFLFDSTKVYKKVIPQEIIGCGTSLGEDMNLTLITHTGLLNAKFNIKEGRIVVCAEGIEEISDDIEKVLIQYNKSETHTLELIKQWEAIKFKKLTHSLLNQVLAGKSQFNVPIMKKEQVTKEVDKGLITYQLKHINKLMSILIKLLSQLSLEEIMLKAIECYERSIAAIELRKLQESTEQIGISMIISKGIRVVLKKRAINEEILEKEGITIADAFYYNLANIEELFGGLAEELKSGDYKTQEMMNEVYLIAIKAVRMCRQGIENKYRVLQRQCIWTADIDFIKILYKDYVIRSEELCRMVNCLNKETLKRQIAEMVEIILNEMQQSITIRKLGVSDEYRTDFMTIKKSIFDKVSSLDTESALRLSIEYKEFEKTIELCNKLKDYQKLYELIDEWQAYNFRDICFQWYIKDYKERGTESHFALFEVLDKYADELEEYLKQNYPSLLWLYYIRTKKNALVGPEILRYTQSERRLNILNVNYSNKL